MTIYVDPLAAWPNGSGRWCHLATDGNLAELHALARRIGLKRAWFQGDPKLPHYDLRPGKRALAVKAGAVEVSCQELVRICRRTI